MADEEIIIDVKFETGEAAKSLKELKQEYKDQQKELSGLEAGSKKYVEQLQKLGAIKDQIGDLNAEIKAFNPEGKIQAFGNVVGGLASGFQAAQGAAALFGDESENVQKALLKVQAVMAFSEGIKGIVGLQDGFTVLWNIIKANPLAAVFTALSAIATAAVLIYDSIDRTSESTKALTKELAQQEEITKALTSQMNREIELLTAQGTSQTEIINLKEKLIKQQLLELETAIKLHQSKVQEVLDNNSVYESMLSVQEALYRKLGFEQAADAMAKQIQISKMERAQEDIDAITKQKEELLDLQNKIKVYEAEKVQIAKNRNEQIKASDDEHEVKYIEKLSSGELKNLRVQNEIDTTNAIIAVDDSYYSGKLDKEMKHQAAMQTLRENAALEAQQLIAATQALTDLAFSHQLKQAQGNAKKEREIRKKQFQVNKAFGIANSVIDGVQAVQKALNNPYPLNIILAVASGIMATANTVKIASTKFDDGGAGVSGDGGGGAVNLGAGAGGVPINAPSNASTQLNQDGTVNSGIKDQKVYVVESEITDKQKSVVKIEQNAKV